MNPYSKETRYLHYLEEKISLTSDLVDVGMLVEVGGPALIICTITPSFRLIDEGGEPLQPYRSANTRVPTTHFSFAAYVATAEDQAPVTFHMLKLST